MCKIDPGDCPIWKSRDDCVERCKVDRCDLKCDPKAMYNAGLALTIIGSVLGGIVVIGLLILLVTAIIDYIQE